MESASDIQSERAVTSGYQSEWAPIQSEWALICESIRGPERSHPGVSGVSICEPIRGRVDGPKAGPKFAPTKYHVLQEVHGPKIALTIYD